MAIVNFEKMLFRFLIVPLAILPLAYGYGKLIQIGDGLLQELYNRYGSNVKDDLYETDFDVSFNTPNHF